MGDEKDKHIFKLPLPLNDDGTWDMAQILGRVSVTFIVELDGDLAKRLAMQTGNFKLLSRWPNERRLQYLAPILWQQMERDLNKWQRKKKQPAKTPPG